MTANTDSKSNAPTPTDGQTKPRKHVAAAYAILGIGAVSFMFTGWWLLTQRVPPPPDFAAFEDVDARKDAFFGYFLPLVEMRNQEILKLRAELLLLSENRDSLSGRQQRQVLQLAQDYEIEAFDITEAGDWDTLLRRVDVVPPSLALAQAANESGWGASRFALEGNNYFGHWCYVEGCGLIPDSRPSGARHEVAAFDSPQQSVQRYIRNLNSHDAYNDLRMKRSELRENDELITGLELAEGLTQYSQRGQEYIRELQAMIRFNNLDELDEPEALPLGTQTTQ
ncbi:glucosaminidase domain-containing protein [Pseudohongiella sp.]|uniref:Mannosyl-glycoprotein endo-beta-N-acetylglucosamidase-like domain-containing protein n=1 Tax=marine sediment metagenome TaxID=412755 RepID=A0A0F9VY91_9ZZZZ|nr:glucosaminidase domain-containing protein [Pseudohongiella sp.]